MNLAGIVASADRKPTAGSVKMYAELKARLDGIVKEYQALLERDVAEFNRAAQEAKMPLVAPAPKIERGGGGALGGGAVRGVPVGGSPGGKPGWGGASPGPHPKPRRPRSAGQAHGRGRR